MSDQIGESGKVIQASDLKAWRGGGDILGVREHSR